MADPRDNLTDARVLLRLDRAALGTIDASGAPYVSLVLAAADAACKPLLLLSDLAEHSKNLRRDARASLLFDGTAGLDQPLTGPRLTLMGRVAPASDPADLARYVAQHNDAAGWAQMSDFRLYRLEPEGAHLVAGFGRIAWLDAIALFSRDN